MTAQKCTANVSRSDGWFVIAVPEHGIFTQTRDMCEAEDALRECFELLDLDPGMHVVYDYEHGAETSVYHTVYVDWSENLWVLSIPAYGIYPTVGTLDDADSVIRWVLRDRGIDTDHLILSWTFTSVSGLVRSPDADDE